MAAHHFFGYGALSWALKAASELDAGLTVGRERRLRVAHPWEKEHVGVHPDNPHTER